MSVQEQTDKYIADIRGYAGAALSEGKCVGTAAVILGLIGNLERTIRSEREEAFCRITALRLVMREIADEADASEPISVRVRGYARDALAADDASVLASQPTEAAS